jgi:hypothetical protein
MAVNEPQHSGAEQMKNIMNDFAIALLEGTEPSIAEICFWRNSRRKWIFIQQCLSFPWLL